MQASDLESRLEYQDARKASIAHNVSPFTAPFWHGTRLGSVDVTVVTFAAAFAALAAAATTIMAILLRRVVVAAVAEPLFLRTSQGRLLPLRLTLQLLLQQRRRRQQQAEINQAGRVEM